MALKEVPVSVIKASGFSLVEVLVSMLLMMSILLSFDAVALLALHKMRGAYFFNVAVTQATNMQERLRGMQDNREEFSRQVAVWNQENQAVLPNGAGTVFGYFPTYTILLKWGEKGLNCSQSRVGETGCIKNTIEF